MIGIIVTFLLAVGPCISWNDVEIITIPLPDFITQIWGVFRSTGRFVFITTYLILTFLFFFLYGKTNPKVFRNILLVACILQMADLRGYYSSVHAKYQNVTAYENPLSEVKKYLGDNKKIYFFPISLISNRNGNREILYTMSDYASENNCSISNFYFARTDRTALRDFQTIIDMLTSDSEFTVDNNGVYVFDRGYLISNPDIADALKQQLNIYRYKDYYIGFPNNETIENEVLKLQSNLRIYPVDLKNYKEGEMREEGLILKKDGISFGPYINLSAGEYRVSIRGSGLDTCTFDVYSSNLSVQPELYHTEIAHDSIAYSFNLDTDIDKIETRVFHDCKGEIGIEAIEIERISNESIE